MDTLFTRPNADQAFNIWILISTLVFIAGAILSGLLASNPGMMGLKQTQTKAFVQRLGQWLGIACGIGLFFVIIRLLQIDPITLGRGIWIVLSWAAVIAVVAWYVVNRKHDRQRRIAHATHRGKSPSHRPVRKKK